MDCTICLENNIKKENMEYMQCGHSICYKCFDRLIRNLCPFCRHIIVEKEDKSFITENILLDDDIYNNFDDYENYQVDNILPQSEINIIYNRYSTYYPILEDNLLQRLNKRKSKKNKKKHCNRFRSNKEKESWERKSKKTKKKRNVKLN
tara:strand:- start:184 stop:630 length:447 start_codon:yes stop_codon:yes gene_type:complete